MKSPLDLIPFWDAAKMLGIGKHDIERLVDERRLRFRRIDGILTFECGEIERTRERLEVPS